MFYWAAYRTQEYPLVPKMAQEKGVLIPDLWGSLRYRLDRTTGLANPEPCFSMGIAMCLRNHLAAKQLPIRRCYWWLVSVKLAFIHIVLMTIAGDFIVLISEIMPIG